MSGVVRYVDLGLAVCVCCPYKSRQGVVDVCVCGVDVCVCVCGVDVCVCVV